MARINTNVASLVAQQALAKNQKQMNTTLERLSTGLRINSGEDDPAGLIASEGLKSEIAGINQAIDNSSRASNVISTAEGALSEVGSMLLNIKSLVVQAANTGAMSPDEIAANQLQVDSAIESITRISNTTTFDGQRLIDGSMDYITSGVDTSAVGGLQISQANFGTNTEIPVNVDVLTSAKTADLQFRTSSITSSVTLEIGGNQGVQVLTFTSGTAASAIAFAINRSSDATGVKAELINSANAASGIKFESTDYGSSQFVSVQAQGQSGSFVTTDESGNAKQRVEGVDAVATINGSVTVGDGLNLTLNSSSLNLNMTLNKDFGAGETSFAITGGGVCFQLVRKVNSNEQVNIGIQSVAADKLGDSDTGFLNQLQTGGIATLANPGHASQIIDLAINQVAILRGRLGAFEKNTLDTNSNSLSVALENVTSSQSDIADADFAEETANLTRSQILTQAGTSVLATANSTPQNVLSLLGH